MSEKTEDTAAEPITDEQLAAAFPGQDVAALRASIGKMDGAGVETSPPADDEPAVEYPEYIPEKFRQGSVEDAMKKMAESYSNLEKTVSGKPAAKPEADAKPASTEEAPAEESADDGVISLESIESEFIKNDGTISEESYAAMEAKGMPRALVDNYIAGQQAIANQLVSKIHNEAGGAEAYSDLLSWAEANLSPGEIAAYDAVVDRGDEGSIKLAVAGLKAQYVAENGKEPSLITGSTGDPGVTAGYTSRAEMTAAMKDPRYKTDESYRKQVEKKLGVSSIW